MAEPYPNGASSWAERPVRRARESAIVRPDDAIRRTARPPCPRAVLVLYGACDAVVIRLKAISSTCAMTFLLDGSAFTPRASLLS